VIDNKGTRVTVDPGIVKIDSPDVVINGNVTVNGTVTATGDVKGRGISLASHTHGGDSGGQTSSPS